MNKKLIYKYLLFILIFLISFGFKGNVFAAYQSGTNIKIMIGEEYQIQNASDIVSWKSNTQGQVTVTSTGKIKGITKNTNYGVTIEGTKSNGTVVEYNVKVYEYFLDDYYSMSENSKSTLYLDDYLKLFNSVIVSSSNENIFKASESNRRVKLESFKSGSAILTIKTEVATFQTKIIVDNDMVFNESDYYIDINSEYKSINLGLYSWFDDYIWKISNSSIASISNTRYNVMYEKTITALKPGDAKITVTNDYGEVATCMIHVYRGNGKITYKGLEGNINVGDIKHLSYTLNPSDSNIKVKYKYYDNGVCKIDANNNLYILKPGVCDLYTYLNGETYDYDYDEHFSFTVETPKFSQNTYELYKNEQIKLEGINFGNNVTYTSSNTSVATIDKNGNVKGLKAGTVTISAKMANTIVKTTVKVKNPKFENKKYAGYLYDEVYTKILGSVGKVTYTSSDKSIFKVDKNGKITLLKAGEATLTAKVSGENITTKIKVYKMKFVENKPVIKENQKYKLILLGGKGKIKYTSSNNKIVTVDKDGYIIGKGIGKAKITATRNGIKVTANVKVQKNYISKKVEKNPYYYLYGYTFVPEKVSYSGNEMTVTAYLIDNTDYDVKKIKSVQIELIDIYGKTIAKKTFKNIKATVKSGRSKKFTFKIENKYIKQKNVVLNNSLYKAHFEHKLQTKLS